MRRQDDVKRIIIHCTATKPDQDVDDETVKRWHLDRGWDDIGYHNLIRRDGSIQYGRAYDEQGAHVRGYNAESLGVCLVGGLDPSGAHVANYTPAQWAALDRLVAWLQIMWPYSAVQGHNQLDSGKSCPCFPVPEWLVNRRGYR